MSMIKRSMKPYKKILGTAFIVDEFRFLQEAGATHWFLSHAHADHYAGLESSWNAGRIYMSEVTAEVVTHLLGVHSQYCIGLPLNQRIPLEGTEDDAHVCLRDAFHCPGAVMFIFDFASNIPDAKRRCIVHTGDFRYDVNLMADWISEIKITMDIEAVYLDTTYLKASFDFPAQINILAWVGDIGRYHQCLDAQQPNYRRTLFAVATYSIGKEKVVNTLCDALGSKAIVDQKKRKRLALLGIDLPHGVPEEAEISDCIVVLDWLRLMVTPQMMYNKTNNPWEQLENLISWANQAFASAQMRPFTHVVAFHASGWTWTKRVKQAYGSNDLTPHYATQIRDHSFMIYNIPYSEHSAYSEIIAFVKELKPVCIIPTVGTDEDIERRQLKLLHRYRNRNVCRRRAMQRLFRGISKTTNDSPAEVPPSPAEMARIALSEASPQPSCHISSRSQPQSNVASFSDNCENDQKNLRPKSVPGKRASEQPKLTSFWTPKKLRKV